MKKDLIKKDFIKKYIQELEKSIYSAKKDDKTELLPNLMDLNFGEEIKKIFGEPKDEDTKIILAEYKEKMLEEHKKRCMQLLKELKNKKESDI